MRPYRPGEFARSALVKPTTIESVEVRDASTSPDAPALLRLENDPLMAALYRPGSPADDPGRKTMTAGRTAIVFVWLRVTTSIVPRALTHRFDLRVADPAVPSSLGSAASTGESAVNVSGVEVPVSTKAPLAIGPPLQGDHWLAANGPDNAAGHRRTLFALTGEARIAQRFAIDWIRLFDDGRTLRGDPLNNASYRAFGATVLAVAEGTVVEVVDGLPENVPDPVARAVPITPETVGGNYILLDLGGGAYAVYAHLQPGSLKVRKGDRVRKGQALALVGNTGNSTEPHLHFQLADRPKAFDAEGIPYTLASFDLEAEPVLVTAAVREVGGSVGIDSVSLAKWFAAPGQRRTNELPLLNAIVKFADAR